MKTKSILTKTIAVAALSLAGIGATNQVNNHEAQAAVVQNDAAVYTTTKATTVYNSYENPAATGQVLPANTNWKIVETAYDSKGQKWYDLGLNQWVLASSYTADTATNTSANTNNTTSQSNQASQSSQNYNYYNNQSQTSQSSYNKSNVNYTAQTSSSSSSYASSATGSEASAKAWIAGKESGGSYSARNGQYVGKYQLSASYLNGDYSAANQERVADNYVKSRYGSWSAAKSFWQANGWY